MHKVFTTVVSVALAIGLWCTPAAAQDPRLVYDFGGLTVERFLQLSVIQRDLVVLASIDSINLAIDHFANQVIRCGPVLNVPITPVHLSDAARIRMMAMPTAEQQTTSAPLTIILTALDQGCDLVTP